MIRTASDGCFSSFGFHLEINSIALTVQVKFTLLGLADGETAPVPCIADAEIVLEGEILPEGWVHTEGPFSEFNRLMGWMHMNPRVRIKSIMHRKDAMYYALHMPWKNIWMSAPIYEAAARRVLFEAGVQTKAIYVTPRLLLPLAYHRVDQESPRRWQECDHGLAVDRRHQTCDHRRRRY